ncbi:MAG: rRNA maturation RNase YbeY [bacterium]
MEEKKLLKITISENILHSTCIFQHKAPLPPIKNALTACLKKFPNLNNKSLSILVTSDNEIEKLNSQYLNHHCATDVLSFPGNPAEESGYIGDIVISYETTVTQATEWKVTPEEELSRLTIHGILHLLGYTDYNEKDRKNMHQIQEEILLSLLL